MSLIKHFLQIGLFSLIAFVILLVFTTIGLGMGWSAMRSGNDVLFDVYLFLAKFLFAPLAIFKFQDHIGNFIVLLPRSLFWGTVSYSIFHEVKIVISKRAKP